MVGETKTPTVDTGTGRACHKNSPKAVIIRSARKARSNVHVGTCSRLRNKKSKLMMYSEQTSRFHVPTNGSHSVDKISN